MIPDKKEFLEMLHYPVIDRLNDQLLVMESHSIVICSLIADYDTHFLTANEYDVAEKLLNKLKADTKNELQRSLTSDKTLSLITLLCNLFLIEI
jgi:hypothetical protein